MLRAPRREASAAPAGCSRILPRATELQSGSMRRRRRWRSLAPSGAKPRVGLRVLREDADGCFPILSGRRVLATNPFDGTARVVELGLLVRARALRLHDGDGLVDRRLGLVVTFGVVVRGCQALPGDDVVEF